MSGDDALPVHGLALRCRRDLPFVNGPQPIVDDTAAIVTAVDDIDVDGNRAVAVVTYRQRIHVLRDPDPPGQLGTFGTDRDGWNETSDRAKVTLAWYDGWKIVEVASLIPGG